jgi:peroxiredoxin
LIQLYNEFKDEGFVVIGIAVREGKEIVKKYMEKHKMTFPVLLDAHGDAEKKYGVRAHPEHFLINRHGTLIGKTLGPRNWASGKNRNLIRALLEQK